MWMLDLKIYHRESDNLHYLEFYDVLESLVKRTTYRAQTMDDIYNNPSRSRLLQGLEKLCDQKNQMRFDVQPALQKVESLRQYYEKKSHKTDASEYKRLKSLLPHLVWATLKVTRTLKRQVKARKRLNCSTPKHINFITENGSRSSPAFTPKKPEKIVVIPPETKKSNIRLSIKPTNKPLPDLLPIDAADKDTDTNGGDGTGKFLSQLHLGPKKPKRIKVKDPVDSGSSSGGSVEKNAQEPNDIQNVSQCGSSRKLSRLQIL